MRTKPKDRNRADNKETHRKLNLRKRKVGSRKKIKSELRQRKNLRRDNFVANRPRNNE